MDQLQLLNVGAEIVAEVLGPNGFEFTGVWAQEYPSLVGRGERVARGAFVKGERRLELELFVSLQNVTYRIGALWLQHEPYMRALGASAGVNAYPGFSNDPIDGFSHLKIDLERLASEFVVGDASVFRRTAAEAAEGRPAEQRRYMASIVGDDRARLTARELFRARQYVDVVAVLEALQHPEFMDRYERRILDIAKRRIAKGSPPTV